MIELRIYEAGLCSGCGYHRTLTTDTDNLFDIVHEHCNVCAALAKYGRTQDVKDKKALKSIGGDDARPEIKRPDDGRHVTVRYAGVTSEQPLANGRDTRSTDEP